MIISDSMVVESLSHLNSSLRSFKWYTNKHFHDEGWLSLCSLIMSTFCSNLFSNVKVVGNKLQLTFFHSLHISLNTQQGYLLKGAQVLIIVIKDPFLIFRNNSLKKVLGVAENLITTINILLAICYGLCGTHLPNYDIWFLHIAINNHNTELFTRFPD